MNMAKKNFTDGYKTYDTSKGYGDADQWRQSFRAAMSREEAAGILQEESPYTILSIGANATEAEIKKAFRIRIAEWHPDKNPDRLEEAGVQTRKILAAYTVLNPKKRNNHESICKDEQL